MRRRERRWHRLSFDQLRRGAWRRDHGRADRAALRQRRPAGAAARPDRGRREAGARARPQAQARSAVHAGRLPPGHHRRLRHAPRADRQVRLDHGSGGRAARHQAAAARESRRASGGPGSIVSSNTSGIPIAAMAEGRSDDFRKHWLGTHFFNPPRYLRLLEIIPTAETDPGRRRRHGPASAITCSARASSSPRTRRTSSPITSACTAWRGRSRCWPAASTRSKRSMRSPVRRSAARAAPPSAPWTSPASTCSRT